MTIDKNHANQALDQTAYYSWIVINQYGKTPVMYSRPQTLSEVLAEHPDALGAVPLKPRCRS